MGLKPKKIQQPIIPQLKLWAIDNSNLSQQRHFDSAQCPLYDEQTD
ncbi:MAG TPA: hypothetical protein VK050_06260 [Flavobacteriaceae bacterium]|nr:hypothetical protein [Flavobacteriaceae bacterium]